MTYRAEYSDDNYMDVFDAENDVEAWEQAIAFANGYGNGTKAWYITELDENYYEIRDISTYAECIEAAEKKAKVKETSEPVQIITEPEAETEQDEPQQFEVGQTYQCSYYKGVDENGNLLFDKANPDNWATATVKILKRTKKTVTIQDPRFKDEIYKPRTATGLARDEKGELIDVEQCWTYEFRMYANRKVTA